MITARRIKSILINTKNFSFLFFALIAAAFMSCTEKKSNSNEISTDIIKNPASASATQIDKSSLPAFLFTEELYDFGKIKKGEKVIREFTFTNSGKADLVISSASTSCGCTVSEYPKEPIHPGKKGVIKVTFNSEGKQGSQSKNVTLIANTIPNTKILTLKGEVIE